MNLLHFLYALCFLLMTNLRGARVVASLYALELGASPFTVGMLAAASSFMPVLLAWPVGRWADRAGARAPMLAGAMAGALSIALPDAPDLSQAQVASELVMVKDHPNQWRPPVWRGMALVGDAAASLDYVHGVGCGWAMQTSAWLADAIGCPRRDVTLLRGDTARRKQLQIDRPAVEVAAWLAKLGLPKPE